MILTLLFITAAGCAYLGTCLYRANKQNRDLLRHNGYLRDALAEYAVGKQNFKEGDDDFRENH